MPAPLKTFKHADRKSIQIAVWPNDHGMSCSIKKSYKDKASGEWKDSKYWFQEDIKALGELCHEATIWFENGDGGQEKPAIEAIKESATAIFVDDDIPF